LDLHDYWQAVRKSWIAVVALVVVGALGGFAYAHLLTPSYRATSSLFVSATAGSTTDQLAQGSTFTQNTVASYAALATTPAVLAPVISELDLDTTPAKLASQITATTPLNTVFLNIAVADASASQAAAIANGVSHSLRTVATELAPTLSSGRSAVTISIVAAADTPATASKPNKRLIEISGAGIGLVLGLIVALARFVGDTRVRSSEEVERLTETSLLGTIRRRTADDALELTTAPEGATAEDYRRVAATLQFAGGDASVRSLVVTAAEGDGRTAPVVLDLALALGERDLRVLVVDGDLRDPQVARLAGLAAGPGLSEVLLGSVALDSAIQPLTDRVAVLTAGQSLSNPSRALSGKAASTLVAEASASFDLVLVESPSVLQHADALSFAPLVDGAVVIVRSGVTKRRDVQRTLALFAGIDTPTIEVVLTEVPGSGRQTGRQAGRRRGRSTAAPTPPAAAPAEHSSAEDGVTHLALK
jgi:succinoglycan biosynthesis transport protein ExoP